MNPTDNPVKPTPLMHRLFPWRGLRWGLLATGILATLIALFYTVEDLRGKWAWEKCKRDLAAQGVELDWSAFIPPPVPDDQNIFKAPGINESDWVGRGARDLGKRMSVEQLWQSVQRSNPIVEITIVPNERSSSITNADLVLRYDGSHLSLIDSTNDESKPAPAILPTVVMDDVKLVDAIRVLAREANVSYSVDPKLQTAQPGPLQATVTVRWTNVSAPQALRALLDAYYLEFTDDSGGGVPRLEARNPVEAALDLGVRPRLKALLNQAFTPATDQPDGPSLKSSRQFTLFVNPPKPPRTFHLVVCANKIPTPDEIAGFFPKKTIASRDTGLFNAKVESTSENTFRVLFGMSPAPGCSAADFLTLSDQLKPEFDGLREALKRPYARINCDYSDPVAIQIPNFITVRNFAQTLADRAKCHLLLGEPDQALQDLSLLHEMRHLLHGKPVTLVAAMIDVALTGLYSDTIADGFRLHAWREPQLVALQKQLEEIHHPPYVQEFFEMQPAHDRKVFESIEMRKLVEMMRDVRDTKESRGWSLLSLAPRGWMYQNLVNDLKCYGATRGIIDLTNDVIRPNQAAAASREAENLQSGFLPYTYIARITLPNYIRAWQTVARNQTMANETQVACALERYRLAQNEYPATLEALIPQFIDKLPHDIIGGQPLKYRRTDDGKFLLYSIGWNQIDDGGTPSSISNGQVNADTGDWVWLMKTN